MENKAFDCHGSVIKIGSLVRLLYLDPKIINNLHEDSKEKVSSMIGDELVVRNIREGFIIDVIKEWNMGNGKTESHIISVTGENLQVICEAPTKSK